MVDILLQVLHLTWWYWKLIFLFTREKQCRKSKLWILALILDPLLHFYLHSEFYFIFYFVFIVLVLVYFWHVELWIPSDSLVPLIQNYASDSELSFFIFWCPCGFDSESGIVSFLIWHVPSQLFANSSWFAWEFARGYLRFRVFKKLLAMTLKSLLQQYTCKWVP